MQFELATKYTSEMLACDVRTTVDRFGRAVVLQRPGKHLYYLLCTVSKGDSLKQIVVKNRKREVDNSLGRGFVHSSIISLYLMIVFDSIVGVSSLCLIVIILIVVLVFFFLSMSWKSPLQTVVIDVYYIRSPLQYFVSSAHACL